MKTTLERFEGTWDVESDEVEDRPPALSRVLAVPLATVGTLKAIYTVCQYSNKRKRGEIDEEN